MDRFNASDPRPRETSLVYDPFAFPDAAADYLDVPALTMQPGFWTVLSRRTCRRTFRQIGRRTLGALLWYTAKSIGQSRTPAGHIWERRYSPSAGGVHPIHIVIQLSEPTASQLMRYDPIGHALCDLGKNPDACRSLREYANGVLDTQSGAVLWLIGDFNKTAAIYENAETLVWRDAGALIGTLCLVSEALDLNCCPLGICGDAALRSLLALPEGVHGVGAVVVGCRGNVTGKDSHSSDLPLPS